MIAMWFPQCHDSIKLLECHQSETIISLIMYIQASSRIVQNCKESAVRPLPHTRAHGCPWLAVVTGIDREGRACKCCNYCTHWITWFKMNLCKTVHLYLWRTAAVIIKTITKQHIAGVLPSCFFVTVQKKKKKEKAKAEVCESEEGIYL